MHNLAHQYEYSYTNVPELKPFLAHIKNLIAVIAPLILWLVGGINPSPGSTLPSCVWMTDAFQESV